MSHGRHIHTIVQPTVVMLGASASPSHPRDVVTFRAHVGPRAPGGVLSFVLDGQPIRGCQQLAVAHSTADCAVRLRPGAHTLEAVYSGTAAYAPSMAAIETEVHPGPPTSPAQRRPTSRVPGAKP